MCNIPFDKICDATLAYIGSLVGVTLEVDGATVYNHEYARILLRCVDVKRIPLAAEGVLGDNFYDFFYEVEKVLMGPPISEKKTLYLLGLVGYTLLPREPGLMCMVTMEGGFREVN